MKARTVQRRAEELHDKERGNRKTLDFRELSEKEALSVCGGDGPNSTPDCLDE
jgi:hypothetical protein